MNRWPKHKPKTEARICLEYMRTTNPVTRSVLRAILFSRELRSISTSRNCLHKLKPHE